MATLLAILAAIVLLVALSCDIVWRKLKRAVDAIVESIR